MPKNKKLGHTVCVFEGIRGVAVPGAEGDAPMRIKTQIGASLEHEESEDLGSDSGESEAAQKFMDLKKADTEAYNGICKGAMNNLLADFVLDEEDKQKEEEKQKKARQAKKRRSNAKAKAGPKHPKHMSFFARQANDSDSDDDLLSDGGGAAAPASRRPGTTGARIAKTGKTGKTSKTSKTQTQSVGGGGGGGGGGDGGGDGDGDGEERDGDGDAAQRAGRPTIDCRDMLLENEKDWRTCNERSHFFGDESKVKIRSLVRWAGVARNKAAAASEQSEKDSYEIVAKKFQVMEMGCKLYKAWRNRVGGDSDKHFVAFNRSWDAMMAFAVAAPVVQLECEFLWHTRLSLKAALLANPLSFVLCALSFVSGLWYLSLSWQFQVLSALPFSCPLPSAPCPLSSVARLRVPRRQLVLLMMTP